MSHVGFINENKIIVIKDIKFLPFLIKISFVKRKNIIKVLLAICVIVVVFIGAVQYFTYKQSKKRTILIIYNDVWLLNTTKVKIGYLADEIIKEHDEKGIISRKLCALLLHLNVTLPSLVLIEEGDVRVVIIGIPSEHLWERIIERFSREGAFVAFSVKEEASPWQCKGCPSQGRLIEGIQDLSEGEVQSILEIINEDLSRSDPTSPRCIGDHVEYQR
jgi:hypothetical protein